MTLDLLIRGAGETVVLVHGSGGGSEETWSEQLPLAERYRLVLPDRRGYGRSAHAERLDFEVDGKDLAELLADGAHLVGFSYGGIGALLAAGRRPEARSFVGRDRAAGVRHRTRPSPGRGARRPPCARARRRSRSDAGGI